MELVSLKPEGKVALTLMHGMHTYSELRFETGLSDRWLARKIRELMEKRVVEKRGKWYGLSDELDVSAYELSLYLRLQASRMAAELGNLRSVKAVILFGSVAQRNGHEYSDLDMIIVVNRSFEKAKQEVLSEISELESNFHVTIELVILTEKDFRDNVHSHEGGIIHGVAEGYEVLVDKTGQFTEVLHDRVEEIKHTCDYLEESGIWLRAK